MDRLKTTLNTIKDLIKENMKKIITSDVFSPKYTFEDLPKEFTDGVKELENQILNAPDKKRKELIKKLNRTLGRSQFYLEYLFLLKEKNKTQINDFIKFHDLTPPEKSSLLA